MTNLKFYTFTCKGLECVIEKVIWYSEALHQKIPQALYGLIKLPRNHPWRNQKIEDLNFPKNRGINFLEKINEDWWVGITNKITSDIPLFLDEEKKIKHPVVSQLENKCWELVDKIIQENHDD